MPTSVRDRIWARVSGLPKSTVAAEAEEGGDVGSTSEDGIAGDVPGGTMERTAIGEWLQQKRGWISPSPLGDARKFARRKGVPKRTHQIV